MSLHVSFFLILINLREYKSILLKGKRASDDQFPWLIQFQTVAPCGGVLLSPDWVLTAAQCVQDKRNSIILYATGLNGSDSKQAVPVKATYIYPTYQAYSAFPDRDYNVALLKLTKPFDLCRNEIILPNVVPVKYNDYYGKLCLIFGWQSYVSPSSKVLAKPIQYYEVILNSWKMCAYMIKANTNYTNVFCAMAEVNEEMKACAGNPGSPVICENQNHETALIGIATWTNFSLECGDLPTYLDLGAFRIWIDGLVFNNNNKEGLLYNNNSKKEDHKHNSNIHNATWNGSDLLQLGSQTKYLLKETKPQSHNVSQTTIKHQEISKQCDIVRTNYLAISNTINDTDTSASDGYPETSYTSIIKEPSNSIYAYEEIGVSQNKNQITGNLIKKHAANDSAPCNNRKINNITVKRDEDHIEIDDFDILLPFDLEDITTSYSNIVTVYSKKSYICFHFVFWYFYIIIYM